MKSPAPEIRPLVTPLINKGWVSSLLEYHDNIFFVDNDRLLVLTREKSRGWCSTARQQTLRVHQTPRCHIVFIQRTTNHNRCTNCSGTWGLGLSKLVMQQTGTVESTSSSINSLPTGVLFLLRESIPKNWTFT